MILGLYQSAAGMLVNEYRQGVIANNLANAETAGFKRDVAVFAEREPAAQAGLRRGASAELLDPLTGGVWLGRTETDYIQGSLVRTEQPTDLAIEGEGFFLVEKGGKTLATRDGRFVVDQEGFVVAAADGAHLLGVAGQPLRVNPRDGRDLRITEDGRLLQGDRTAGVLGIVNFADYRALQKVEGQRFAFGNQQTVPAAARILQGVVETSGSQPIRELTSMMESARAYQLNASMLTLQDQTAGRLISVTAS